VAEAVGSGFEIAAREEEPVTAFRLRVAEWMRRSADRLDHEGAPKVIHWSFTFEEREGIRFRDDGKGCPLAYLGDADYERAHSEADRPPPRIDWKALAGGEP
jgi:hypothetical protein